MTRDEKVAVLRIEAVAEGLQLPYDVVVYLATQTPDTWSAQELKDVFLRLSVVASLSGKEMNVPFAREQLGMSLEDPAH
jgi:chromosomal replication initiation ATPase DnaA